MLNEKQLIIIFVLKNWFS